MTDCICEHPKHDTKCQVHNCYCTVYRPIPPPNIKIAGIRHNKCGEFANVTYVWIHPDMTPGAFQVYVDNAQKEYLSLEQRIKTTKQPAYVNPYPEYKKFPEKSVAEVDAQHTEALNIRKEWEQEQRRGKQSFEHLLVSVGEGKIWSFYDGVHKCTLADADWGHNHGVRLSWGEDNPNKNDFNKQENTWW